MDNRILKKLAIVAAKEAAKIASKSPRSDDRSMMSMMASDVKEDAEEAKEYTDEGFLECPHCGYEGLPSEFVKDPKTVVVLARAEDEDEDF